jgi:hypothetical protein
LAGTKRSTTGNMTTEAIPTPAQFSMGRVIGRALGALGRNFVVCSLIAAIAFVPSVILAWVLAWLTPQVADGPAPAATLASLGYTPAFLGNLFVTLALGLVLHGALVYGTITDIGGRRAGLAERLAAGLRAFLPLTRLSILTLGGVMLGAVALVIPGIMLATAWSVASPALVVGHAGVLGALSRSARLTKGKRGAIFALLVLFVIVVVTLTAAARHLASLTIIPPGAKYIPIPIIIFVLTKISIFASLTSAVGVASLYEELLSTREGIPAI